jgi:putative protein-disulfide isomerase
MIPLYFYHDPMCSWCWGYRPVSDELVAHLPDSIELVKIVGGLAPDSDQPMPEHLRQGIPAGWRKIHSLLGTEFNFDFWTKCKPRRSTYPACRAVLAAGEQDRYDAMIDAIQRAYYLRAMNPSDIETLEQLAEEIDLDAEKFARDIRSAEIEEQLQSQVDFARQSPIDGFPSLVLEIDGRMVPIKRDYKDPKTTLDHIRKLISGPNAIAQFDDQLITDRVVPVVAK